MTDNVEEMVQSALPAYDILAYEMTIQLVDKNTGERSDPMCATPTQLCVIFKDAFDKHGQNLDDHAVLVLTQEVPKDDVTMIIISRLPMISLPKFIDFVKEYKNV